MLCLLLYTNYKGYSKGPDYYSGLVLEAHFTISIRTWINYGKHIRRKQSNS